MKPYLSIRWDRGVREDDRRIDPHPTDDTDDTAAARTAMVDALRGGIRRPAIVTALGAVPRHLFLPGTASFDRIVVTAGAWDVPPAWTRQLVPSGRLVLPLRRRGQTRCVALAHGTDGVLRSDGLALCGFIPLAGGRRAG